MRRLRFATLYRSQKRSSARSSLSLSMIDILKSRGCFFTGGEGLWVTGYGLAVGGLEVESEFHTCTNEVSAGFSFERKTIDVLDNGNFRLLELGVGNHRDGCLGIDLAAIAEIRRSVAIP